MFKKLFGEHGAKNVVTLFHKPSSQASTRVLTLLKQRSAAASDQASGQNKAETTQFDLDVMEAPPTGDQLKSMLEYLGGSGAASKLVQGASDQADALRRLKENGDAFQRPVVVDWNQGKAVVGGNESEILSLLQSITKEGDKA